MECREVMGPVKTPLYADEPAGVAIDFMVEKRSGLVPVVDRDDKFVGMVSGDRLMHFMIPQSIGMMRGRKYAGYLRESREELEERLDKLRARTVGDLLDHQVKVAKPEMPLIEALMLLSDKQFVVPVVDDDGKLVGAISFFSVLRAVKGWEPGEKRGEKEK